MNLAATEPRGDLASTGYALARPGEEYLVLQAKDTADPFTVTLAAGTYAAEWHSLTSRKTETVDAVTVDGPGSVGFTAPFADPGPAVLHLKR
jgi:hypothetical protein